MFNKDIHAIDDSTKIKMVSEILGEILPSFVQLPYKLSRENINPSHAKGDSSIPGFSHITFVGHKPWRRNFG